MIATRSAAYVARKAEQFLNRWITRYVNDDTASMEAKAHAPLRERGSTFRIPCKPGAYRAVAFLRPHFQLEEPGVSAARRRSAAPRNIAL